MSLSPATAAVTTWIHTAVASGVVPAAFTPLAQGGLARATKRLSSRHLLPGPIGPSARQDADCGFRTVAADGVAKFSRHRHALMPMGPGDEPRDDSGVRRCHSVPDV